MQGVYALRLSGDRYYVGSSTDMTQRIPNHSSSWTETYPIQAIDDLWPFPDASESELHEWEREVTLRYMEEKGWERVRGAAWCQRDLERPPIVLR